jgi:hypothetical protein
MTHLKLNQINQSKMSKKYLAMTPVENVNFSSIYTPEIYFDEWTPCITVPWSRLYNDKTCSLQSEWTHLNSKSSTYFLFKIPEKAIHGLLFIDNGKVFFKDHHKGRLSQARIRNCLKGMNIFGAFWIPHHQSLILHDIYMHESTSQCEEVFITRWQILAKALTYIENDNHLQGFTLSVAAGIIDENAENENTLKKPVNEIDDSENTSIKSNNEAAGKYKNIRAVNETHRDATTCLILQPNIGLATIIHSIPAGIEQPINLKNNKVINDKIECDALITKHTKFNGPESFQIWSVYENKDLGMPCIQNLKLLQQVCTKLKEIDKFIVNIKWNKNLNSYEVLSIK